MQNPNTFYKEQLELNLTEAKRLFKQMSLLSLLRLVVFVLTVVCMYITFNKWQIAVGIAILGVAVFLFLLSKYTDLKSRRAQHKRLVFINEEELKIAKGDFHNRPDGSQFQNPKHYYSLDIDLFGKGSFFQFMNRTTIKEGTEKLTAYLLSNTILNIKTRQNAIKELAALPQWRQQYSAIAQGVEVEHSANAIIKWLKNYKPFINSALYWFTIAFSLVSVAILVLGVTEVISISLIGYWLLLGLGLTAAYLKRINSVAQNTSKAKDTFKQYHKLLNEIENATFTSEILKDKQQEIKTEVKKASVIFKEYSKLLDALDQRNNVIITIFGNGLFLRDIKLVYKIEKWIETYKSNVEQWFKIISFFDAQNSLANFAFNHPSYVFPEIKSNNEVIKATNLGHTLLKEIQRVDNDFIIKNQQFFIITGANMAGKSTFLRTVSLHIVMANVGLPICATSSEYSPIKLITSMRTSDSLTDNSSYFFSELTRLKLIVDTIKTEPYFIILDEILKGTNSTDKAIGSRKFVEKLVKLNATGIIATHDLSLTEIETELDAVKNYYFDAQIINDELYFDYKLKQGVCQNMNASFLLKKMEII